MLFICKKEFSVQKCEDNGFSIENEELKIEKGSIWYLTDANEINNKYISLEKTHDYTWIEIDRDTLDIYFENIKCAYCNEDIEGDFESISVDSAEYFFHMGCDYIPKEHLTGAVGNSK